MNKPSWIRKHVGIVSELTVQGSLEYLHEHPHPWAIARFELTQAENALQEIWEDVYGEQTEGTDTAKKAATGRDPRIREARRVVAKAAFEVDQHLRRLESAKSFLSIYQTESKNNRELGKLG